MIPRRRLGAFLFAVLAITVVVAYLYAISSPLKVSAEEARRRLKAGEVDLVIDVRTAFERATLGSYDGSVHIPAGSIEAVVPDRIPKKDTRILLYCNTGQRARAAAEKLEKMGYKHVSYIVGGPGSLVDS